VIEMGRKIIDITEDEFVNALCSSKYGIGINDNLIGGPCQFDAVYRNIADETYENEDGTTDIYHNDYLQFDWLGSVVDGGYLPLKAHNPELSWLQGVDRESISYKYTVEEISICKLYTQILQFNDDGKIFISESY
jgi:hypothetical protein